MYRYRQLSLAALLSVGIMFTVIGCTDNTRLLPQAGGRPYEVLVVGDRDSIVYKVLSIPAEGLPQHEPMFDVSAIDRSQFNAAMRIARSIIMVSIDPSLYTSTRIRYEKDVYAQSQIIIHIYAPSTTALKQCVARQADNLRTLLGRHEINAEIGKLKQERNAKAERQVKQMFGVEMWIPMDMVSSKQGKNFLWLSNNSPTAMQNIVIYKADKAESTVRYVAQRDSVMAKNIKGETDEMYMTTVAQTVTSHITKERNTPIIIHRGLWEMRGDDMGGAFVSHTIGDITVEAFVFTPGMKKRNQIRHLEAALYTLKI